MLGPPQNHSPSRVYGAEDSAQDFRPIGTDQPCRSRPLAGHAPQFDDDRIGGVGAGGGRHVRVVGPREGASEHQRSRRWQQCVERREADPFRGLAADPPLIADLVADAAPAFL